MSDPDTLGFQEAVTSSFYPLISRYGFVLASADPHHVTFTSDRLTVDVWRDPNSYEIDLTLIAPDGSQYSLEDASDSTTGPFARAWQASTRVSVQHGVEKLADALLTLDELSRDGLIDHSRLKERQRARKRAWKEDLRVSALRGAAAASWNTGHHDEVARALEALGDQLTPLERARLAYIARRQRPLPER